MEAAVEFIPHVGSRLSKKSVAAIGPRLFALREDGSLTPEAVVKDARKKDSPLHPFFEWDNEAAAAAHRIEQARYLIRSVDIVITQDDGGEPKNVRAFVSIEGDGEAKYIDTLAAMNDPDHRRAVVARALEELEHWRKRYERFSELGDIFAAMEKVRKRARKKSA